MISLWNKNISLFQNRFPELFKMLMETDFGALYSSIKENPQTQPVFPVKVEQAKNGSFTASWNNLALHSKYNPQREAEQAAADFDRNRQEAATFFSLGLGYTAVSFAVKNPAVPMIVVEPDPMFFATALFYTDFEPVLTHSQIVFIIGADLATTSGFFSSYSDNNLKVFQVPSQWGHAQEYFLGLIEILKQNRQKQEINNNTLERFAHLWLKNSIKNLPWIEKLNGIEKYRGLAASMPFVVLAAGPSLEKVLPHIKQIQERAVVVCVDTALHACLKHNLQPDFIVLVDPQYACALHLAFLKSPGSVLIAESAVWPSVFRFECREKVLCSSLFPIGQYFEKQLGNKGKLGAGGSVTTTAWDFARVCGAKEIFIAGMDLGFPHRQTHIRGSQFEERSHRTSNRLDSAQKDSIQSLVSAGIEVQKDYTGKPILTDKRMSLFSWWFHRNCTEAKNEGVATYSLTGESLAIEGIELFSLDDFLLRPEVSEQKKAFFENAQTVQKKIDEANSSTYTKDYSQVRDEFIQNLEHMMSLSRKGMKLCQKALENRLLVQKVNYELGELDREILSSGSKDSVALVFPTERQLEKLSRDLPKDELLAPIYQSRLIYSQIEKAAKEYLELLK